MQKVRIMIVDDHNILREGLISILNKQPDFEVVGETGSVDDALELAITVKPELVLMDYGIMGGTGVDATRAILAELPETRVVFLTVHESDDDLFNAIRSGAVGYLLKDIPVTKLIESLRGLMRGEAPLSRKMTSRLMKAFSQQVPVKPGSRDSTSPLTPRELDILRALASGATNQEIAESLFVSVNTVKNHVHNILDKLNLESRRAAAKYALEQGLIDYPANYIHFTRQKTEISTI